MLALLFGAAGLICFGIAYRLQMQSTQKRITQCQIFVSLPNCITPFAQQRL